MSRYDTAKLANMEYGDATNEGSTVELTPDEVNELAWAVSSTIPGKPISELVREIETAGAM